MTPSLTKEVIERQTREKEMDEINRLYLKMRTARIEFKLAQANYKAARYRLDLWCDSNK